jgi:DNA polymerase III subunit gamma/tau
MSYQALARKWRPKSFAELVGQDHVVTALANALRSQRLHHAYLFTGTRGVGKTTLARILAKALNCETGISATACGICAACVAIDSGHFVDLLEVDAATNTRAEEMRELLDNTQYMPTSGRFKVYIIDEVHMLSRSAFNSMLKTLEEPPEHVKFILATTDPQKVPVTVLSRCLQFNLKQMSRELISAHLQRVLDAENVAYEVGALNLLARAAHGSMRDSLSLLDQAIAFGAGRVEVAAVAEMLGTVSQDFLLEILEKIAAGQGSEAVRIAEQMAQRSVSFDAALQDLASILHQVALRQSVPGALPDDLPELPRIAKLGDALSAEDVQLYYQIAIVGRRDLALAPDEFAGFTMALMRMLAFRIDSGSTRAVRSSTTTSVAAQLPDAEVAPLPAAPRGRISASQPATADALALEEPAFAAEHTSREFAAFDGNWLGLVGRLKLGGMAGMLAQHCELKSHDGNRIELVVLEEHRHLAEKQFVDKLEQALRGTLGVATELRLSIGPVAGNSLAAIGERERQERQAGAVEAIEKDDFVRDLVERFDARLIESSIRPIQQSK